MPDHADALPGTGEADPWDAFIGSAGPGGDPELSARAKDILRAEMGT